MIFQVMMELHRDKEMTILGEFYEPFILSLFIFQLLLDFGTCNDNKDLNFPAYLVKSFY